MTEAFFAVIQTSYTKAELFGLVQEFLAEIAVREVPEMLSVLECVRQGKKDGLLCAVRCQSECGDTADINCARAADHAVQYVSFNAENAGTLQIDLDGAAGHSFNRFLELGVHCTADSIVERVNFSHCQSNCGISLRCFVYCVVSRCFCRCRSCLCRCCCRLGSRCCSRRCCCRRSCCRSCLVRALIAGKSAAGEHRSCHCRAENCA